MTHRSEPARGRRIADLTPERRQLVEKLLHRSRGADADTMPPPGPAPLPPAADAPSLDLLTGEKEKTRRFYDQVNAQLDPTPFGPFSFFLNYGYVSDDDARDSAVVSLPEHALNRQSVKLVLETLGDCPLDGRKVLDVGCGRGGTVTVLRTFFRPAFLAALDLSPRAIEFCRGTHRALARFLEADAEQLPFLDSSFDAVTNIESSHLYPEVGGFYREVLRVLRPGGRFLYSDLQPADRWRNALRTLHQLGFDVVGERDITNNVLLSCDQLARQRVQAFQTPGQAAALGEFLGAPGSVVYNDLARRAWVYMLVRAVKR